MEVQDEPTTHTSRPHAASPPPKLAYFPANGYQIDTSKPPQEHLAFTPDGRCLSWSLNTGQGWRIRVFRVPGGK